MLGQYLLLGIIGVWGAEAWADAYGCVLQRWGMCKLRGTEPGNPAPNCEIGATGSLPGQRDASSSNGAPARAAQAPACPAQGAVLASSDLFPGFDVNLLLRWGLGEKRNLKPKGLTDWIHAYGIWCCSERQSASPTIIYQGKVYSPPKLDQRYLCKILGDAIRKQWEFVEKHSKEAKAKQIARGEWAYMRKLRVDPAAQIIFLGSLRGGVRALLRSLEHLKTLGRLNDKLVITAQDAYLIVGGDFIDCGTFGIEVATLLAQLYLKNPNRVVLIRGASEGLWDLQRFHSNKKQQDMPSLYAQVGEYFPHQEQHSVFWEACVGPFVHTLPSVVYVETKNLNPFALPIRIQCSHGGLEPAFDPVPFLNDPEGVVQCIDCTVKRHSSQAPLLAALTQQRCLPYTNSGMVRSLGYRYTILANSGDRFESGDMSASAVQGDGLLRCGSKLMHGFPEVARGAVRALLKSSRRDPCMSLSSAVWYCLKEPGASFPIPIVTVYSGAAPGRDEACFVQVLVASGTLYCYSMSTNGQRQTWAMREKNLWGGPTERVL